MGHTGETDWAGIGDVYFAMALVPAQKAGGVEFTGSKYEVEIPAGVTEGQTLFQWITRQTDAKETRHLTTAYVPVVADGSLNKLFVGVKDYFSFAEINKHANEGLGRAVDLEPLINYSWYEWLRWIFKPITQLVLIALSGLIGLTGSAGWSIILFTILLYSVFFPLKWHSAKSFKAAQKNAPRMKEIQEEMKRLKPDDPRLRELQLEQIRSMNPGNMLGGCLPMFLQIPFFIALYSAITISLDFRQASFLWLPDLSSRDPYHLLEFAQTGSMIISMIFAPATPAMTDEQRMQQKMMTYMMPAMMLWVLWGAPSGLLLYWFFGNLVTIGQQAIINYFHKKNEEPAAVEPEKTVVGKKKLKAKVAATETKG
jgi:YidC/Oxa1 family membrane protein insertase